MRSDVLLLTACTAAAVLGIGAHADLSATRLHGHQGIMQARGDVAPVSPAPQLQDPAAATKGKPVLQKLDIGEATSISVAMQCVLCLTALYYFIMTLEWAAQLPIKWQRVVNIAKRKEGEDLLAPPTRTGGSGSNSDGEDAKDTWCGALKDILAQVKGTIPMLAILIVFARLRAKVDLEGSTPPDYSRKAMYGATAVIYLNAFFSSVFSCQNKMVILLVSFVELAALVCLIGCIGCIFYAIVHMKKETPEA